MKLLIVESPTKSKTISRFLGSEYKILASFGHVRDLPKRELGVDVDHNFEPKYVIPPKAKKIISELKKESAKAEKTILATDEDREGESISWHLAETLKLKEPERIVFHEITKTAIEKALENPGRINMDLVGSQQARRILDRIVGYKLSPFLWKKVAKGLSAGRVQSVAVRLVVEREREIQNFKPVEYWSIEALFQKIQNAELRNEPFAATLAKKDGKTIDKLEIKNKNEADDILKNLENAEYKIEKIERKETKRNPLPPFTTSTLQQSGWQKFHFPAKMTMSVAQKLYEEGYITYHRTDSVNLSEMSLSAAKNFIEKNYGSNYWAGYFKKYKSKGNAQEAHEAIRPAYADKNPESVRGELDGPKLKLYTLIWQRFIASQMKEASFDSVSVDISAKNPEMKSAEEFTFTANGQTLKFEGFLKVYQIKFEEKDLPNLEEKEKLDLVELNPLQHSTQPPARYTEASLIKELEKNGIGRPSTYAPTIATIQDRNYIEKNQEKRFMPTEMGTIVNDILVANFPEIVDIDFTAKMEKELDEVAEGKDTWVKTCRDFYDPFSKNLKEKYQEVPKENLAIKTDKKCPKCGSPIVERLGKFGRFYACSAFPECKYTESLESEKIDIKCPKCKEGNITVKKTKKGKIFYGCGRFPECDFAVWDKPVDDFCKTCGSIMVQTKRGQIKCPNKDCLTNAKEKKYASKKK